MITSGYGRSASDTPHPRTPAAQLQARCGQRDAAASARSRYRPAFTPRHRTDGALRHQPRSTSLTRYVVVGAGAVGGAIGVRLHETSREVVS